jgi:hypothetical protein
MVESSRESISDLSFLIIFSWLTLLLDVSDGDKSIWIVLTGGFFNENEAFPTSETFAAVENCCLL